MTDETQPTDADRATDTDEHAETQAAGEPADGDDSQEVAIDAVLAEDEDEPVDGDQQ